MNTQRMRDILEKIKEYDRIVIFRHKRPDGDAVGSTKGLQRILQLTYPEKEILLLNCDYSDYVAFLGKEDEPRDDAFYKTALGIVVDTATTDRISNPKYALCKELIKIDHHIEKEHYGNLSWVEEERSSACEMIAKFYYEFRNELQIDLEAATYVYTGMVTDSGRFRFRSVSGETLRLAGMLLDMGIDTDHLYANLYLDNFDMIEFKGKILRRIKRTQSGVAYLYVSRSMRKKLGLSAEQAGMAVSYMDSIRGSLIWLAFIESDDGTVRVRLRSRFVTVSELAEIYSGGGHACAAGATVHSQREVRALLRDADSLLREYKATHEDWL
ncbi:MAG: bifunctional oligoribonuclease/PAP phosphatase NrnA [Ruminococcaceae bacterium]|nr:bifunctional oligoribonuclease/PAP phosphatase NrnA [Oscillospiraceae bacterium]